MMTDHDNEGGFHVAKYTNDSIKVLNPPSDSFEDRHTLYDGDLVVGGGDYQVIANGRHYCATGHNGTVDYITVYRVPAERRDTPGTPENKAFKTILKAIELETLVEQKTCTDQKVKGKVPGHLYLNREDYLYLYLGRLTLVNPTTLETISGYMYQKLGWLRNQYCRIADNGQLEINPKHAPMVGNDGVADYTVQPTGKVDRTIELKVVKSPATFKADLGEYTTTQITGLQVRFTGIRVPYRDAYVSHEIHQEVDAPVTLMPVYPVGKQ